MMTSVMGGTILIGVDLRDAKLPIETTMNGVSLTGADLRQTDLRFLKDICKRDVQEAVTDQTIKFPEKYLCSCVETLMKTNDRGSNAVSDSGFTEIERRCKRGSQ
jgi:pentapeptide repeat protein